MGTGLPLSSNLPIRGPRKYAAIKAATPPKVCTAPLPEKSWNICEFIGLYEIVPLRKYCPNTILLQNKNVWGFTFPIMCCNYDMIMFYKFCPSWCNNFWSHSSLHFIYGLKPLSSINIHSHLIMYHNLSSVVGVWYSCVQPSYFCPRPVTYNWINNT